MKDSPFSLLGKDFFKTILRMESVSAMRFWYLPYGKIYEE